MALTMLAGDNALTGALPSGANNSPAYVLGNGSGSFFVGVHTTAVSGTSPTLTVKVQDSPDGTTWTDISGLATSALSTANVFATVFGHSPNKFVRVVGTVGGSATPTVTATVTLAGFGAV